MTWRVTGWDAPRRFERLLTEGSNWGYSNAIPWFQAAHGSPYFPNGRCEVELTVKMVRA